MSSVEYQELISKIEGSTKFMDVMQTVFAIEGPPINKAIRDLAPKEQVVVMGACLSKALRILWPYQYVDEPDMQDVGVSPPVEHAWRNVYQDPDHFGPWYPSRELADQRTCDSRVGVLHRVKKGRCVSYEFTPTGRGVTTSANARC